MFGSAGTTRTLQRCAIALPVLMLLGCPLFQTTKKTETTKQTMLKNLAPPEDALQLEIVYAERPVGDPILNGELWREVSQISAVSSEAMRKKLTQNGFRVGIAGPSPPPAMEAVLEATKMMGNSQQNSGQLKGRKVLLRSGSETEVQVSPIYPKCEFQVPQLRELTPRIQEFTESRCVFRVKAERLQQGWVKLTFLPEIHHGSQQLRQVALQGGWQYKTSQEVEPVYAQQFEMELSTGEIAVLSSMPHEETDEESLGSRFFVGPDQSRVQRLLIIRLAHSGQVEKIFAEEEHPRE